MFEPARFLRLARAQVAELWRGWAWFLGIGVMVHFVLVLLQLSAGMGYRNFGIDYQVGLYFTGLFITGAIFAGRHFQGMSRRESAVVLLMRPATAFEKWLFAAIVVIVAYPLAYSLAFQICNVPSALYAQAAVMADLARAPADDSASWVDATRFGVMMPWHAFETWRILLGTFLMLASLTGFALWGSLYFRVMPFILTIVTGFVLLLLMILLVTVADGRPDTFLGWWSKVPPADGAHRFLMPLAWVLLPGLLWLAALFALREREVA